MAADVRVRLSAEGLKEVLDALDKIRQQSKRTADASSSLTSGIKSAATALKALAAAGAVLAVVRNIAAAADAGLQFNSTLESARLGIAAIVAAQAKLVDGSGRQLDGAEAYNAALGISSQLMQQLQKDGLRTAATTEQLVGAFQAALSAGMGSGITDLKQIEQLVVGITQAASAMQVPMDQLKQEITSILRGQIDRNSIVGKNLGISNADIQRWREQGTLVQELTTRLAPFNVAADAAAQSWTVMTSNMEEALQKVAGAATEGLFARLKRGMSDAFDAMITKAGNINPRLQPVIDTLNKIGSAIGDGITAMLNGAINALQDLGDWIQKNSTTVNDLVDGFRAVGKQIGGLISDVASIFTGVQKAEAETGVWAVAWRMVVLAIAAIRDTLNLVVGVIALIGASIGEHITAPFLKAAELIANAMDKIHKGSGEALRGFVKDARAQLDALADYGGQHVDQAGKAWAQAMHDISTPTEVTPDAPGPGGAGTTGGHVAGTKFDPNDPAQLKKVADARAALLQAQAQQELALAQTRNKLTEDANKRALDQGLIDVTEYYRRKRALADADYQAQLKSLAAEADAIKSKRTNGKDDELAKQKELGAVVAKQQQLELQHAGELAALDYDRQQAERDANRQRLATEQQIAEMEGDRWRAAEAALKQQLDLLDEQLRKQGVAADERKRLLAELQGKGQAANDFDANSATASAMMQELDRQRAAIEAQQQAGQISGYEAQGRILELERARLDGLKQIGAQLEANAEAAGRPELVQQAKDFNAQVAALEVATKKVGLRLGDLRQTMVEFGQSAIADCFGSIIDGTKSVSQAFADMGKSIVKMIGQMIAKLIAFYVMLTLLKAMGPYGQAAAKALEAQGPGFATGGYTGDMGTGQVAGVVHGKEYVINAQQTARWRPLLEAINGGALGGMSLPAMRSGTGYATGGYVEPAPGGAGGAGGSVEVNIYGAPEGTRTEQKQQPDGKAILNLFLGEAASSVRNNGPLGAAIQQTFGLTRGGTRR